jgi:hypothetical protein
MYDPAGGQVAPVWTEVWGRILHGCDLVLICRDSWSQRYREFRQYVSTAWPPGTPIVPSQYRVQRHNGTFGICPNMGSRFLPRVVTQHSNIHTRYLVPNQDRDVMFLVPVVIIFFQHPPCSRTPSSVLPSHMQKFDVTLTSTVFYNHIGIVWIMSASLCSSEILWFKLHAVNCSFEVPVHHRFVRYIKFSVSSQVSTTTPISAEVKRTVGPC